MSSSVEIRSVHPVIAGEVFDELAEEFKRASRHGFLSPDDMRILVDKGRLGMLAAIVDDEVKGAVLWEFMLYPSRRTLNIVTLVGKRGSFRQWSEEIVRHLERMAAENGCDYVVSDGRMGWLTEARKLGFKTVKRTSLVKEIAVHERQGRGRLDHHDDDDAVGAVAGASPESHSPGGDALRAAS